MLSAGRDAGSGMRRILLSKCGSQKFIPLVPMGVIFQQRRTLATDDLMSSDTLGRWTGGRESASGIVATVFGASGLVGPHVVTRLARIGSHVIIPYRGDGWNVRELKCMGALGKVNLLPLDMADESTVQRAVAKSNVVINLLGRDFDTRNYTMSDTNVKCTYRIAKCAAATGHCERFIQVSAEGADLNAESEFYSSKAQGEECVREFFPNATVIRPNTIFGVGDKFINRIGHLVNYSPVMPTFLGGVNKMKPIWVNDVAQAIINSLYDYRSQGKTYHISGPEVFTQKQVNQWVIKSVLQEGHYEWDVQSEKLLNFYGWLLDKLPSHGYRLLTPDLIKRMKTDVLPPGDSDVLTEKHLGIEPRTLADRGRYILERHIGDRQKSYQKTYGVEHSRLDRNPWLHHPNYDAADIGAYGAYANHFDGVMPDGNKLPNSHFDWEAYQKKHPGMEYEKRMQ